MNPNGYSTRRGESNNTFFYLVSPHGLGFMPLHQSGKGYTWTEPGFDGTPRLLHTYNGAQQAIRNWVRGPMTNDPLTGRLKLHKPTTPRQYSDWEIKELIVC